MTETQQQAGTHRRPSIEMLRRSLTDRKVAGVAGGLGRHLDVDPTILRVLLVVLCFFGGTGFLLYGVAWLLVPEDGRDQGTIPMGQSTRTGLLAATGVLAALLLVGDSWDGVGFPWPLLLVGLGVLTYLLLRDGRRDTEPQPVPPPYDVESDAPPWLVPTTYAPQPPPPTRTGPTLFGPTLALGALSLGTLGLYDVSGGAVVDPAYPALALAVVGLMLVVGSVVGRAGGLILLGLAAALALAVTSAVGTFDRVGFGDGDRVSVAPTSASGVRDSYQVESGRVSVDLSDVTDPQALDGRRVDIGAGAGEIVVVLPHGVRSEVNADIAGPGQIDLPDQSSGGLNTDLSGTYGPGPATVTIDTSLSAGHIDVRNP